MLGTTLQPLPTWDLRKQIVAKTRESTSYHLSRRYEGLMNG